MGAGRSIGVFLSLRLKKTPTDLAASDVLSYVLGAIAVMAGGLAVRAAKVLRELAAAEPAKA